MTLAGTGGIWVGVGVLGCFASRLANILFFDCSMLLPGAEELTGGSVSRVDKGVRLAGGSSPSSLGRLRGPPCPSGDGGNPRDFNSPSSC